MVTTTNTAATKKTMIAILQQDAEPNPLKAVLNDVDESDEQVTIVGNNVKSRRSGKRKPMD